MIVEILIAHLQSRIMLLMALPRINGVMLLREDFESTNLLLSQSMSDCYRAGLKSILLTATSDGYR